nr:putative type II toxin-antitoxin system RelE/ParE family toxin [uncultured bacterium]
MRGSRLSPQAEKTLEEILGWTIENFGIEQATIYKNQLITRLTSLAADEYAHGRSCNTLISHKREAIDLEYYRQGRHYIIYRNTKEGVFVLDFVHGSRALEAIVIELDSKDGNLI